MEFLKIAILAVVQGITEFLPVSSSGHEMILSNWFGIEEHSFTLNIVFHAGSLLAITVFYFKTLLSFFSRERLHLLAMVIIGTIPAGVIGIAIKMSGKDEFMKDPLLIGVAFLITGAILRLSGKQKLAAKCEPVPLEKITLKQALAVGFSQAFAIMPGISRSGSTITAGILTGIERESAGTFSFLLAIPAIGGAVLIELLHCLKDSATPAAQNLPSLGVLAVALVISAIISFGALALLMKIVKRGKFSHFAWYLFALGVLVILWQVRVRVTGR